MITKRFLWGLPCASVFLISVFSTFAGDVKEKPVPAATKAMNGFAFNMLKYGADSGLANAVFLPQSVYTCLAVSYIGTGGDSRKELQDLLKLSVNSEKDLNGFSELIKQISESAKDSKIEYDNASALWLDNTYAEFSKEYIETAQKFFGVSLNNVKYRDKESAANQINLWVASRTHGKITGILSGNDFKSRSSLLEINEPAITVVNAVYFKADWSSKFNSSETENMDFHPDQDKSISISMMHKKADMKYSESSGFRLLEIPCAGDKFSMCIIMPESVMPIKQITEKLTRELAALMYESAVRRTVDLLMPKFNANTSINLKSILQQMGVKDSFDREKADFDRKFIKNPAAYRIYISEIKQKTTVDICEEGSEAASATASIGYIVAGGLIPEKQEPKQIEFHADHPFVYFLVHRETKSIIFAGFFSGGE